jgi:hypothetical protein
MPLNDACSIDIRTIQYSRLVKNQGLFGLHIAFEAPVITIPLKDTLR